MEIIITDLTRFKKRDNVCTAGVTLDGAVVRPWPYLRFDNLEKLGIHPGGILQGEFQNLEKSAPHTEDASYGKLVFKGPATKQAFRQVLEQTLFPGLCAGFETELTSGEKCIPVDTPPPRSLITIRMDPKAFSIEQDSYDVSRLRAHFTDETGMRMAYVGVTDLGFFDYAQEHAASPADIAKLEEFIQSQDELFLRVGLSRVHKAPDGRHGYWIQLNSIYTFPNYLEYIRCYE